MGDSLHLGVYSQPLKVSFQKTESGPPPAGVPRAQLAFLWSPECTHDPLSLKPVEWFSHGHGFLPELS